jgi:hypothetical protein
MTDLADAGACEALQILCGAASQAAAAAVASIAHEFGAELMTGTRHGRAPPFARRRAPDRR